MLISDPTSVASSRGWPTLRVGLEHDSATRNDSWRKFVGDEVELVVERRDGRDQTNREAPDYCLSTFTAGESVHVYYFIVDAGSFLGGDCEGHGGASHFI